MNNILKKSIKSLGLTKHLKALRASFNYKSMLLINNKKFITHRLYGAICEINEPWMLQVLKVVFELKKGPFMDVGVNLGQTLIEAKAIDSSRPYYGFEPNPSCVMYVEELIKINKLENVTLIPVGLFNADELLTMDLYYDDITNSGGSVIKDYWEYSKKAKVYRKLIVPVLTIDTIEKSLGPISFEVLKIDVEGDELEVLKVLKEKIISYKPIIIMEVLSAYSTDNTLRYDRQLEIIKLIREIDYRLIRIEEGSDNKIKYLEIISDFDVNYNPNMTNYIIFHKDNEKKVIEGFNSFIKKG